MIDKIIVKRYFHQYFFKYQLILLIRFIFHHISFFVLHPARMEHEIYYSFYLQYNSYLLSIIFGYDIVIIAVFNAVKLIDHAIRTEFTV